MRLAAAARMHLSHLKGRLAPATIRQRRYDLESFVLHIGAEVAIKAIKKVHIEEWLAAQVCAASTLKLRFLSVRMLFRDAYERGWIHRSPCIGIRIPRPTRYQPRALDLDELRALGRVLPDERARLIISLGVCEGLRRVEIANLEFGDVNMREMTLRVVTAKAKKEDVLPLTATTLACLAAYVGVRGRGPGPLIRSYTHNGGLSAGRIGAMTVEWMREAGIKERAWDGKSLHATRHTRAASLLKAGADPTLVQQALRHSSLSTTWAYLRTHKTVEELRPWMNMLMDRGDAA